MAWETAAWSEGSTPKASPMQLMAMSIESFSSAWRVPSLSDLERKSQIASARRCFVVAACWAGECQRQADSSQCPKRAILLPAGSGLTMGKLLVGGRSPSYKHLALRKRTCNRSCVRWLNTQALPSQTNGSNFLGGRRCRPDSTSYVEGLLG